MSGPVFSLILNGTILVLLAATIFFAARLSLNLRDFRASRKDLDQLVRDLAAHVTRAEGAIAGMRETAQEAGRDLQEIVNEAKTLSEELQLMSEAGNSLAGRLEKLAERNGRLAGLPPDDGFAAPSRAKEPAGGFAIRDPEFEAGMGGDDTFAGDDEADDGAFQSRAEKELFEALQGRQNKGRTGKAP